MNEDYDYDYVDEYGDGYQSDPTGTRGGHGRYQCPSGRVTAQGERGDDAQLRKENESLRQENKLLRHTLEMVKEKTQEIEALMLEREAAEAAPTGSGRHALSDRPQVEQLQF